MFNDIHKSQKVFDDFCAESGGRKKATTADNKYGFAFNVQVIQSGAWPIDTERMSSLLTQAIPPKILLFYDDFAKFYTKRHEGTRLIWDYVNNNVEVEAHFPKMVSLPLHLEIPGDSQDVRETGPHLTNV